MANLTDHAALNREIEDGEARVKLIKTNLNTLDRELGLLNLVKSKLEENIRCLKTNKIVAMAQEYKKAKEELKKTGHRIEMLTADKVHFAAVCNNLIKTVEKNKLALQNLEKNKSNNILKLFKDKTDGQK